MIDRDNARHELDAPSTRSQHLRHPFAMIGRAPLLRSSGRSAMFAMKRERFSGSENRLSIVKRDRCRAFAPSRLGRFIINPRYI